MTRRQKHKLPQQVEPHASGAGPRRWAKRAQGQQRLRSSTAARTSTPSCSLSLSSASVFASRAEFVCRERSRLRVADTTPQEACRAHLQERAGGLDAVIQRACELRHPRKRTAAAAASTVLLRLRLRLG